MKTRRMTALTIIMVLLFALLPSRTPALADLTPSAWALPEMNAANISGLLTPSAARDFHNALTRDEFCELVVEMVELTLGRALPVPAANPFTSDVDPISIHALKAWNYGIITGITTTLFAPAQKVERQQLCAMMIRAIRGLERDLNRTLLSPGLTTLPYRDAALIRDYAIEPVQLAYTNVIMQGSEQGMFMPANDITSQECVAVIIRSFNRIEAARTPSMNANQLLDAAADRVHIGYAYGDNEYGVSQNLLLPTTSTGGATVSWTSSNNGVIRVTGSTGTVTTGAYPQAVTLTATIRIGNTTRTKVFELTTSPNTGDRLLLENALSALDILYLNEGDGAGTVTGRIGLPTSVMGLPVTWQTNNPSVVSNAGIVNVPNGSEERSATLIATIRLGSQTRTKNFNLTVVNPSYSRGVALHGVQFGMTQAQVAQLLGTSRRSVTAGGNETWQLFYSNNYSNFIAVAFIGDRAAAVYSMASGVANQLRNRSGSVISVAEANSSGGTGAVSYTDPGSSSQQYAIMIYDTSTTIGTARNLQAEGQEQLLFELVNAFRQRNSKSSLEWTARLGTPAREHSNNSGSGNLQQRVTRGGFDSSRYVGGNVIPGNGDAFDALNQIVSDSSGSSSMRTAILQNNITLFGAGFSGGNSGSYRTYFTFALGNVTSISGVTARQNDTAVNTVNVSAGAANAMTISLIMSPSGYNESFTVASSNTSIMTVTGFTSTSNGGTVVVTGVANGSANITVTGNCSGKSYNVPVSVGTVYASALTLSYTPSGMSATTLSNSTNVAANTNANANGSRILVIGTGESINIAASTTNGATVEWARTGGNAANVSRNNSNNNGVVTATNNSGVITLTARARTGTGNTWITHTITVHVVSITGINVNPTPINVGVPSTASVTVNGLPNSGTGYAPVYAWSSSGNQLTKTSSTPETASATFNGANTGNSTITFTATWAGSGANSYLGKITKSVSVTVEGNRYAEDIRVSQGSTNVSQGTINMIPGQVITLTASTVPAQIIQNPISFAWTSLIPDFATVARSGTNGATGTVTAVTTGTSFIEVVLSQGDGTPRRVNVTIEVGDYPTISINNPGEIEALGPFVQFVCNTSSGAPSTLPAAYSLRWSYTGDNATIDAATGMLAPTDAGPGTVTAELLFNGGVVRTQTRNITIVAAPDSSDPHI